jgi:type II secretory pathway component PulC
MVRRSPANAFRRVILPFFCGRKPSKQNFSFGNPEAGLEKGDIIIEINGKKVYSADSVTDILNDNNGKDYKITVKRNTIVI